jgi:nickel/cobalt transporter (NicO) family protein
MANEIIVLAGTAATIGFLHTLFGPDHYIPFIFMAKARRWSLFRTSWITIACGIGHVGSSIVVGAIGIVFGIAVWKLEAVEGYRGSVAAWAIVIFGFGYFLWGLRRAIQNKTHKHIHFHNNGMMHTHDHDHVNSHDHIHKQNITPWILFTIFVLGPCEPLIPFLMYPAAQHSMSGLIMISGIFSLVTIGTMLLIVLLSTYGFSFLPLGKLEKYTHALAGAIILLSGLGIVFLGM